MIYTSWIKSILSRLQNDFTWHRQRRQWWQQGVSIAPTAVIRVEACSVLEIGEGSLIADYSILDLLGDPLNRDSQTSRLQIGRRSVVGEFSNVRAAGQEIVLGDNCLLAQFVSLIGANHSYVRGMPIRDQSWNNVGGGVRIGDDVWIGAHAVILPGVTIGAGSIIAAGAVVTTDIPEFVVAGGVPARVIKAR